MTSLAHSAASSVPSTVPKMFLSKLQLIATPRIDKSTSNIIAIYARYHMAYVRYWLRQLWSVGNCVRGSIYTVTVRAGFCETLHGILNFFVILFSIGAISHVRKEVMKILSFQLQEENRLISTQVGLSGLNDFHVDH